MSSLPIPLLREVSTMPTSRREMFSALGPVAAGQALIADAVGQERNPAAQVEDRPSTIKIPRRPPIRLGGTVYVKISTNHGVVGWGEIKGVDPRVSGPLAESLF